MRQEEVKISRALISVTDKTAVVELAQQLSALGVEIISTGGTAKVLSEAGINIIPIQEITGSPEAFGGRMKSISFQVGSALLYRRHHDDDIVDAKKLNIRPIDLVVCNLYPFEEVLKKKSSEEVLVENIDIGGPTMIRAAAKNFESVTCLTASHQYKDFLDEFKSNNGKISFSLRRKFSSQAFALTAHYDSVIASYFVEEKNTTPLPLFNLQKLRYGENPHQAAWLAEINNSENNKGIARAKILQGKTLSYNNLLDADASWKCNSEVWHSLEKKYHAVTVVKHANPCGVALADSSLTALQKAWACDPISAFGSIITFSHELDAQSANWLSDKFIEIIIAPHFSTEALEILGKKKNLRLLECPPRLKDTEQVYRSISGGILIQEEDELQVEKLENVTKESFDESKILLAKFGLSVGKYLKSNGITLVGMSDDDFVLAGAGMGQPNRLDSLRMLAAPRAKELGFDPGELVLISDAFFPFRDSIEAAHEVGIKYIVQPGGSIRDQEVIEACNEFSMGMVFTGVRHFRH